jgi:hypothetical protein
MRDAQDRDSPANQSYRRSRPMRESRNHAIAIRPQRRRPGSGPARPRTGPVTQAEVAGSWYPFAILSDVLTVNDRALTRSAPA